MEREVKSLLLNLEWLKAIEDDHLQFFDLISKLRINIKFVYICHIGHLRILYRLC